MQHYRILRADAMNLDMLHPAVVHVPLGIALLLPLLCLVAVWLHFGRHEESALVSRFWFAVVLALFVASAGALLSHSTGEAGEHAVEKFIPKEAIERHEDYSKIFAALIYTMTAIASLTLIVRGRLKGAGILLVTLLSLATLGAGYLTGNEGGKLVYTHKAANYLQPEARPNKVKPVIESE
jgi:uncharacterized membrane protein